MSSNPDRSKTVDVYLEEARAMWGDDSPLPERDELRDLAEEAGMDNEASEAADERSQDLTRRAQKARNEGNVQEAIEALRDAILLSPVRVRPHLMLGRLYAEAYATDGAHSQRQRALQLAERAQSLEPSNEAARTLIKDLGDAPQDSLPWKKAALIVIVIVLISGSMQLCHRHFIAPEVTDEQLDEVRQYLEEHGEPQR